MRTENDLRRAFALLEDVADRTETDRVATQRRRYHVAPPLAVAATVAAVATVVVTIPRHDTQQARRPAITKPAATITPQPRVITAKYHSLPLTRIVFSTTRPGTKVAGAMSSDHTQQELNLAGSDGSYTVTAYSDTHRPPSGVGEGDRVTVNGHRGFYSDQGLVWEYARGAWATLTAYQLPSEQTAVALASAIRFGTPTALRVPLSFADSGATLSLWNVGYGNDPNRAGQHGDYSWNALFNLEFRGRPLVLAAGSANVVTPTGKSNASVDGHPAYWNATQKSLTVRVGSTPYALFQDGSSDPLGKADLITLAQHVRLAPKPADTSTWFDAAAALPHR